MRKINNKLLAILLIVFVTIFIIVITVIGIVKQKTTKPFHDQPPVQSAIQTQTITNQTTTQHSNQDIKPSNQDITQEHQTEFTGDYKDYGKKEEVYENAYKPKPLPKDINTIPPDEYESYVIWTDNSISTEGLMLIKGRLLNQCVDSRHGIGVGTRLKEGPYTYAFSKTYSGKLLNIFEDEKAIYELNTAKVSKDIHPQWLRVMYFETIQRDDQKVLDYKDVLSKLILASPATYCGTASKEHNEAYDAFLKNFADQYDNGRSVLDSFYDIQSIQFKDGNCLYNVSQFFNHDKIVFFSPDDGKTIYLTSMTSEKFHEIKSEINNLTELELFPPYGT